MKIGFLKQFSIPLALLLLCFLSYGLLIPWLGFYWDDWVYTWFGYILGPGGFQKAFANDRPFLSLIYMITTSILGQQPIAWQITGLLAKWGTALLFWFFLRLVWPQKQYSFPILMASLFHAIYPGFSQHSISVIYSQAYILYGFFLFSMVCMVLAVRSQIHSVKFTIIAIISAMLCHLSTEYFFGLEFLRPFFLWVLTTNQTQPTLLRLKTTFRSWGIYLIVSVFYILFRYLQTLSPDYQGYEFSIMEGTSRSFSWVTIGFVQEILSTIQKAGISAWSQTSRLFTFPIEASSTWLYLSVLGITFAIILFLGFRFRPENHSSKEFDDQWGIFSMVTGLAGILLGRLPSWIAGLPFGLEFPYDRFMLSTGFGASLFMAGLIIFLVKSGKRRIVIMAAILALTVGWNFYISNTFRRDWQNQTEFFKQLSWRIPAITPGTILMTHELPLKYYSDNSLTAPLNWIYDPDPGGSGNQMPYILIYTKIRLGQSLDNILPDQPVHFNFRAFEFNGTTSDTISIYYPVGECLRILDTEFTNGNILPGLPGVYEDIMPLTDLDRIILNPIEPASLPTEIFKTSSQPDWCYYFEKAELARQGRDFKRIVDLANEAESMGLSPKASSELFVFIEGFAYQGLWDKAEELSNLVLETNPEFSRGICQTWKRVQLDRNSDMGNDSEIKGILARLNCIEK
jgi:hypothetical protein